MTLLFPMFCAVLAVALLTIGATAVRTVSRLWLRHWIEHRHGDTHRMSRYLERPMRLVHAASTGIAITVFTMGALIVMQDGARSVALVRDILLFGLAVVVLGQLLPRALGRRWAPRLVPIVVPVLRVVDVIVTPFLHVASAATGLLVPSTRRAHEAEAREGLEDLLRDGAFESMRATEEMAIISGVMQFGEKTVSEVMTPQSEMFVLDESLEPMELARRVAQSAYSRVPIYRGSPDHIVGMLYAFDVLKLAGARRPPLRPITITSPSRAANELLFELLRARRQLAIVQEDGGAVVGLVTMEDLLEELVGDIRDEHDEPTARGPGAAG
ncbi:MAG: CNNM domain-containing protein [Gemmatimonas sp.]